MKVAFLSNYTVDFIVKEFSKRLKENSIQFETYVSGFNQYVQEILGKDNSFYKYNPDVVFLSVDLGFLVEDILDHQFEESGAKIYSDVENRFQQLLSLISKLRSKLPNSHIFIDNFYLSTNYLFKTLEGNSHYSTKNISEKLNLQFEKFISENKGIRLIDIASLFQKYGEEELLDSRMYYIAKSNFSKSGSEKLAGLYLSHIKAYSGLRKKIIVLDLDNTLWGGIIGEDGIENIILSNDGAGKAFYNFQKELLKLYRQGILLAVCSKNAEGIALDAIKNHPYMILREKHFAAMRINWNDKVQNIKSIAQELSLGTDSFVFLDDSVFERGLVKNQLPEVEVPELPEDSMYFVDFLKSLDAFNFHSLTDDDFKRNESYATNRQRKELEETFTDTTSYLKSLEMQVIIREMDDFSFPRIVQLIQKTNQFNLTTRRYTETEVRKFAADPKYKILQMSVKDKFGDYGIVAVTILKFNDSKLYIDTFLMSCRVLGRNVETALLAYIIKFAEENNLYIIEGEILPTIKNEPCLDMYAKHGFDDKDNNFWELNLREKKIKFPEFIKLSGDDLPK